MSEEKDKFVQDEKEEFYEDIPPPPKDIDSGIEPKYEPPSELGYQTDLPDNTIIEPEQIDADLQKKKKRRKWILISIFGITLPILIIVGVIVFIFMSIIGAFETCAVNCCNSCGESCANSCEETCCTSCSESCNNSCDDACSSSCDCSGCSCNTSSIKITLTERIENIRNILKWTYHSIFGFFFE